ncbi:E3 ubiquitin-protein ligase PUB22-like [Gastrolobium bilobum]|uniref:E3 ubiquitin-protein ligase PUB22-like n=1 Tax=Gastrolobium bilobum TaxID=150636 RepID=UPI002AB3177E|nr:E3 ubiquitin-protein ligase PUB22-like [Gastrolobium bilobum]
MDNEIDVPPFFLCPISLEIMKDPVTVSTGITYDRESIEKWLFSEKNKTCPVTNLPLPLLSDCTDLTPNHTLRRLIQAWCTMNSSHGIQRIPTPKPPVNKNTIEKLLKDASDKPQLQIQCLRSLKSIASESETNRRCIESSGAVHFLASLVINNIKELESCLDDDDDVFDLKTSAGDDALCILHSLNLSETGLKTLLGFKDGEFMNSLTRVMQRGIYDSQAYAVLLMKSMSEVANSVDIVNLRNELFIALVHVLKDQISHKASKATLQTLIQLSPWGRNRIKAVEAGAIPVLIELLLDCKERKPCEMMLVLLETLCQCADGRAELLSHGAGLAIVSKKILRVSTMANDRAVKILLSISRFSATPSVVQEMLQLGVVAKLCLVLQVDSGSKAKEKAREILKLHARSWRNSPCIPSNLLASYPTSV